MDIPSENKGNYTKEILLVAGYILFFCLASILCITYYYFAYSQQQPARINVFATSLPAITPSPHIPLADQSEVTRIFEDDFSDDQNHWKRDIDKFRQEVRGGKLFFESRITDNYAFTGCGACPSLEDPYYLQADFATTAATDESFGIVFNIIYGNDDFYLFLINTEAKKYYFYRHIADNWSLRAAGESAQIKSFPASNTLGVYANLDTVELYVNGEIVDSYKQSGYSFQAGRFGFYVDDSGFKLTVDNLIINKVGR